MKQSTKVHSLKKNFVAAIIVVFTCLIDFSAKFSRHSTALTRLHMYNECTHILETKVGGTLILASESYTAGFYMVIKVILLYT